jgi:hypothetical protein
LRRYPVETSMTLGFVAAAAAALWPAHPWLAAALAIGQIARHYWINWSWLSDARDVSHVGRVLAAAQPSADEEDRASIAALLDFLLGRARRVAPSYDASEMRKALRNEAFAPVFGEEDAGIGESFQAMNVTFSRMSPDERRVTWEHLPGFLEGKTPRLIRLVDAGTDVESARTALGEELAERGVRVPDKDALVIVPAAALTPENVRKEARLEYLTPVLYSATEKGIDPRFLLEFHLLLLLEDLKVVSVVKFIAAAARARAAAKSHA